MPLIQVYSTTSVTTNAATNANVTNGLGAIPDVVLFTPNTAFDRTTASNPSVWLGAAPSSATNGINVAGTVANARVCLMRFHSLVDASTVAW